MKSGWKSKSLCLPAENGAVLACPELPAWPALVRENQAAAGCDGRALAFRAQLLEMAQAYTRDRLGLPGATAPGAETVIATGHQPLWHHCGIWIKSLACGRLARALGGTCVHMVLDHDNRPTTLTVPERRADGLWQAVHLDIVPGEQMGGFVDRVVQGHDEQFCNQIWRRQGSFDAAPDGRPATVADVVTRLQAVLYAACGLEDMLYLPVSRLSESQAFGDFVASIMANPVHFAHCYNQAAAGQAHGEDPGRSGGIRPLVMDPQGMGVELPFWLVRPDGWRTSLQVRLEKGSIIVPAGTCAELGRIGTDAIRGNSAGILQFLKGTGWAIRPKAVTLTLFARLYLADWFIHGLGGVQYESVTDHVLREYYRVPVPAYGMITCTAILPLCRSGPGPAGGVLPQLCSHHRRHNPEERFGEPPCWPARVRLLVERKRRAIATAGDRRMPADRRKAAWKSICAINRQLRDCADDGTQSGRQTVVQPEEWRASRAVEGSREYFFGLFPESALARLAGSVVFPCFEDVSEEHIRSTPARTRTET